MCLLQSGLIPTKFSHDKFIIQHALLQGRKKHEKNSEELALLVQ